jgi:hypothetical protein
MIPFTERTQSGLRPLTWAAKGCVLTYIAAQADHAYRLGKVVGISGHVGVLHTPGKNPFLALKIKVQDLDLYPVGTRPHFAYVRSDSWSTARSDWGARDLVDDFRAFAVTLSDDAASGGSTRDGGQGEGDIALKRTEDDMELQFPLDLMVSSAEPIPGGTYRRTRSPEALTRFRRCVELIEKVSSTSGN